MVYNNYNIAHHQGDTLELRVAHKDDEGKPIDLTGYALWVNLIIANDTILRLEQASILRYDTSNIVVVDAMLGDMILHISAADTHTLAPLTPYSIKGNKAGFVTSFLHGFITLKG